MHGQNLVVSALWACVVAATLAARAVDLATQGPYMVPITETRLCVLGVYSPHGNIELRLVRPTDKKSVTVSLAMSKYDHESQISAVDVGDNVAAVSRDKLNLTRQLISIFRKDNVLAVYRAGQVKPVLVYKNKRPGNIDFADFTTLYMSGPRDNFTVHLYDLDKQGPYKALAEPHGKAVRNELNAIRKEIYTRLKFLNVVLKDELLNIMSQQNVKEVNDLVENLVLRQLFVLDYYGVTLDDSYEKLRQKLINSTMPRVKQRLGR